MNVSRHSIAFRTLALLILCGGLAGSIHAQSPRNRNLMFRGPVIYSPRPASFPVGVRQGLTQPDPTTTLPIVFDVMFTVPIFPSTFQPSDVVQTGTATGVTWAITNSGDDMNFTLEATAIGGGPSPSTVVPVIPAGKVATEGACSPFSAIPGAPCGDDADCPDGTGAGSCAGGTHNMSSVSVDNSVTYGVLTCATKTHLYAAGWSPAVLHRYCVEANGALTHEGVHSPPGDTRDLQIEPGGQRLYYASADLTKYTISTDGSLAEVGTLVVGGGSLYDLTFGPGGRYLYGTHSAGRLYVFDTQVPTTLPSQIQLVTGLIDPHGVAVLPNGSFVYVANQWSFIGDPDTAQEIVIFPRLSDGTVNVAGQDHTAWDARPDFLAVDPTSSYIYYTDRPGGALGQGQISGGQIVQGNSEFSGFGATQLAINAAGSRVYVTNYNDDDVSVFSIDGSGQPSLQEAVDTGDRPEHLVLHPNGLFLYVISAGGRGGSTEISTYSVAPDGSLTEILAPIVLGQGGYRLAIVELP